MCKEGTILDECIEWLVQKKDEHLKRISKDINEVREELKNG